MMPLRCGEYAAEEAGRDLADLRAENDAVARRLATMSKRARDVARNRALRAVPLDVAVDVRADFDQADRFAQRSARVGHVARVIPLARGRRASHRAVRRVDVVDDSEDDPARELRAVVDVFRILNQWYEEQA